MLERWGILTPHSREEGRRHLLFLTRGSQAAAGGRGEGAAGGWIRERMLSEGKHLEIATPSGQCTQQQGSVPTNFLPPDSCPNILEGGKHQARMLGSEHVCLGAGARPRRREGALMSSRFGSALDSSGESCSPGEVQRALICILIAGNIHRERMSEQLLCQITFLQ